MGDDNGEGNERPQHKLFLPDYRIGKYLLTNAEYKRFIEAGGHKNKRWWTETGWQEVNQRQNEPWSWQDDRFNKPNLPVVGISWYEGVAYCRWLSAEMRQPYRLPSEAEWEKAARGVKGRQYPWGNKFEAGRLNVAEGEQKIHATTPVGIYPMGVSPFGVFDCAGNVSEWCATKAVNYELKPYPYDAAEAEWSAAYLAGTDFRVLRGGSWSFDEYFARCACRVMYAPLHRDYDIGCRLAASPIR